MVPLRERSLDLQLWPKGSGWCSDVTKSGAESKHVAMETPWPTSGCINSQSSFPSIYSTWRTPLILNSPLWRSCGEERRLIGCCQQHGESFPWQPTSSEGKKSINGWLRWLLAVNITETTHVPLLFLSLTVSPHTHTYTQSVFSDPWPSKNGDCKQTHCSVEATVNLQHIHLRKHLTQIQKSLLWV